MRLRRLEQAFWSAHSRNWDDSLADAHVLEHIAQLTAWLAGAVAPETVVVDLGCGTGNHSVGLAGRGLAVVGADLSPGMLHHARDKAATHGVPVSLVRVDLQSPLPFREGSVSAAISIYAAQFLDLPRFFGEVRRILRPGGTFLVEVPRPDSTPRAITQLSWRYRSFQRLKRVAAKVGTKAGVVRPCTAKQLTEALDAAGLRPLDQRATSHSSAVLARRIAD